MLAGAQPVVQRPPPTARLLIKLRCGSIHPRSHTVPQSSLARSHLTPPTPTHHEVEVGFSAQRHGHQADHLVQGNAAVDHRAVGAVAAGGEGRAITEQGRGGAQGEQREGGEGGVAPAAAGGGARGLPAGQLPNTSRYSLHAAHAGAHFGPLRELAGGGERQQGSEKGGGRTTHTPPPAHPNTCTFTGTVPSRAPHPRLCTHAHCHERPQPSIHALEAGTNVPGSHREAALTQERP